MLLGRIEWHGAFPLSDNGITMLANLSAAYSGGGLPMNVKKLLAAIALCAIVALFGGVLVESAHAQNDSQAAKTVDKDVATRRGVNDSLAKGKIAEEGAGPNKTQMAIGIGSVVVMIIVVKWL
jgi:hypothetical protein